MIWLSLYGLGAFLTAFYAAVQAGDDGDEAVVRGLLWPYLFVRALRTGFRKFRQQERSDPT